MTVSTTPRSADQSASQRTLDCWVYLYAVRCPRCFLRKVSCSNVGVAVSCSTPKLQCALAWTGDEDTHEILGSL
jgi:hypothetical protein